MLSVLIMDRTTYEYYLSYEYFFNWFEDHGDVRICLWERNTDRQAEIDEVVPQLFETIKNVGSWNAYIVDRPFHSIDYLDADFKNKTQYSINPYENNRDRDENFDPENDPLLRLVYFLGGRGIEQRQYITSYHFRASRPLGIYLITPRIFAYQDLQIYAELSDKYQVVLKL